MTYRRLARWALIAIAIDLVAGVLLALLGIHYTA